MSKDTILINNIYTGDFTNENIGHEIINSYKPDEGEFYYVYVSPYGFIVKKWDERIKTILFTRNAGKNKIEVIAKAELENEEQNEFTKNRKEFPKLSLTSSKDFDKQKLEWKRLVKTIDQEYINFKKNYKEWEKISKEKIKASIKKKDNIKIEDLIQNLENELAKIYPIKETYKNHHKYQKWISVNKSVGKELINTWETQYDNWKNSSFKYLKEVAPIHIRQVQYIYENKVTYGKTYLCDIFERNEGNAFATYFGFKTKNLAKPNIPIYLEYGDYEEGKAKNKTEYGGCVDTKNEKNQVVCRTYYFKHVKLANQKCYKFFNKEEFITGDNFNTFENNLSENEKDNFIPIKELDKETKKIDKYKKSFLVMIKKQYDELSYSNMLYHFFSENKNLFLKFAKEVLSKKYNDLLNMTDISLYEIKREYNDIDLLIIADERIFIIENKIKSGINGIQHDPYNEGKYCNQLTKYYSIIKKEYDAPNVSFYPFIFKPDYNQINIKNLEKSVKDAGKVALNKCKQGETGKEKLTTNKEIELKQKVKDDIDIINKYRIINYSELYKFFEEYNLDLSDDEFFRKQFLLSLKIHSESSENIVERDMELKFREAINKLF